MSRRYSIPRRYFLLEINSQQLTPPQATDLKFSGCIELTPQDARNLKRLATSWRLSLNETVAAVFREGLYFY